MNQKSVLIGADPELFVAHEGKVSSAIGLIGGTKDRPRWVDLGALQEDNVLLEFNVDPAGDSGEFIRNIRSVIGTARDVLSDFKREIVQDLSSHSFSQDELESFGKPAFVFGCDPDFNAWTRKVNPKPAAADPGLRTAGGHLHIGYDHIQEVNPVLNTNIIRMCDYRLGLPSVLMDKDDRRRELYGKGGAMRHKSYGPEYRTLSNFWLNSDELIAWAFQGAKESYEKVEELEGFLQVVSGEEVQRIINTNDKVAAKQACDALGVRYA